MKQRGVWFGRVAVEGKDKDVMIVAPSEKFAFELTKPFQPWMGPKWFNNYFSKVDTHVEAEGRKDGIYFCKPHTAIRKWTKGMKALIFAALLRVWWSTAPGANGIFLNWIWLQQDGVKVCYAVVQQPQGTVVVAQADIIKTGTK